MSSGNTLQYGLERIRYKIRDKYGHDKYSHDSRVVTSSSGKLKCLVPSPLLRLEGLMHSISTA